MASLPDGPMQRLLQHARQYSEEDNRSQYSASPPREHMRDTSMLKESLRRQSTHGSLMEENVNRRLSEAGVNRRPSAHTILTEDTESFIIGESVYVDGVKPGRIQFIGETKFGPGDWAGVVLDHPYGKNDGSVANIRYFQCEPRYGVFSRLFRLTREPIEGAEDILRQMNKYGYEIIEAPIHRRGSVGSGGGSRRGSLIMDEPRRSSLDRGSLSPRRGSTPEARNSPDPVRRGSGVDIPRRTSLTVPERRGSLGTSPHGRKSTPGRSPLASPMNARSNFSGGVVKIEQDPAMTSLASEARRLSMGGGSVGSVGTNGRRDSNVGANGRRDSNGRRPSSDEPRRNSRHSPTSSTSSYGRRPSDQTERRNSDFRESASPSGYRRPSTDVNRESPNRFSRKQSESLGLARNGNGRRGSEDFRRGSSAGHDPVGRRPSSDLDAAELRMRRQSEAGLRRTSATDVVLNEFTENLMVGQRVWVDGTKPGRIAFIGSVHFAKGDLAGVHLDEAIGKNNGTVGGIMYFQCEPKHGIFSRLHRLATQPMFEEEGEYEE